MHVSPSSCRDLYLCAGVQLRALLVSFKNVIWASSYSCHSCLAWLRFFVPSINYTIAPLPPVCSVATAHNPRQNISHASTHLQVSRSSPTGHHPSRYRSPSEFIVVRVTTTLPAATVVRVVRVVVMVVMVVVTASPPPQRHLPPPPPPHPCHPARRASSGVSSTDATRLLTRPRRLRSSH